MSLLEDVKNLIQLNKDKAEKEYALRKSADELIKGKLDTKFTALCSELISFNRATLKSKNSLSVSFSIPDRRIYLTEAMPTGKFIDVMTLHLYENLEWQIRFITQNVVLFKQEEKPTVEEYLTVWLADHVIL